MWPASVRASALVRRRNSGSRLWACGRRCDMRRWSPMWSASVQQLVHAKGEQWQRALCMWSEMRQAQVEPNVIRFGAAISACERGAQWQQALGMWSEMRQAQVEPNVISFGAAISACEKGAQRQQAVGMWSVVAMLGQLCP